MAWFDVYIFKNIVTFLHAQTNFGYVFEFLPFLSELSIYCYVKGHLTCIFASVKGQACEIYTGTEKVKVICISHVKL